MLRGSRFETSFWRNKSAVKWHLGLYLPLDVTLISKVWCQLSFFRRQNITQLEIAAIANALQLEGRPTSRHSLSALITTPMPSLKSLSLSVPSYSVFTADTLCYALTLTFDLWPWTILAVTWSNSERNRAMRDVIIAIWILDLMILNMSHVLRYGQDSLHKV